MACGIIKHRANKKSISYFFDFLLGMKGFLASSLIGGVEEKCKNNCNPESLTQFTGWAGNGGRGNTLRFNLKGKLCVAIFLTL